MVCSSAVAFVFDQRSEMFQEADLLRMFFDCIIRQFFFLNSF